MTSRRALPRDLPRSFTVEHALESGVARNRLDALDMVAPFRGVRLRATLANDFDARCRALATTFRAGDAFTGPTAALLWGMPVPKRLEATSILHVSSHLPARAMRRPGVIGSGRSSGEATTHHGIAILQPWEVCRSLAPMLSLDDLVAVMDFIVTGERGRYPLSSPGALDGYLRSQEHRPGMARMRRAAPWSRVGAWSRPESILRLVLLRASLPEPELNLELPLPSGGKLIPDMAWPQYRVAAEYNGIHHDKPGQRVHDLSRIDDFTDIGWVTVNVERVELFQSPLSAATRVAHRLASRGWEMPRG
jgi:hypothetical protein